jgi:hypothetical protein
MIVGAVACVTASAMMRWRMVEDTVSKAPDGHRYGLIRWYSHPNRTLRLWREHRRLYPRSRLRFLHAFLLAAGVALGIGAWII